ncbi:hypothetical protein AAVH_25424 [Aphelenchoides avenae]|nr:hypothetical protein AAVH_25424 [Aphelenchus avenae]
MTGFFCRLQLTRHQLFVFLPKAADFKVPSHVALRIKHWDTEWDELDYNAPKWLQLMRTLGRMHGNSIRIRPKCYSLIPTMLRTLYEEYMYSEEPTGVELYTVWDHEGLDRDVESVAAELGLRLTYNVPEDVDLGTYPDSFRRFWQSAARQGFKFSVKYAVGCNYHGLTIRVIKDCA